MSCTGRFSVCHAYADRKTTKNHLKSSIKNDENNFAAPTVSDCMAFLMENVSVPAKYREIAISFEHSYLIPFYSSIIRSYVYAKYSNCVVLQQPCQLNSHFMRDATGKPGMCRLGFTLSDEYHSFGVECPGCANEQTQ